MPPTTDTAMPLAPGLRASDDARRLAVELGFAAARLEELATSPPGLYAEVASEPDIEEAAWLAFLIAYLSPVEGELAFDAIAVRPDELGVGRAPGAG